jgi:hypothetical protein
MIACELHVKIESGGMAREFSSTLLELSKMGVSVA